jgi:hypothetical protein
VHSDVERRETETERERAEEEGSNGWLSKKISEK